MHANYLDTLDWGILIAYFLILIGIGIWASLKRKKGSSLFLAERSLKWHHPRFINRKGIHYAAFGRPDPQGGSGL